MYWPWTSPTICTGASGSSAHGWFIRIPRTVSSTASISFSVSLPSAFASILRAVLADLEQLGDDGLDDLVGFGVAHFGDGGSGDGGRGDGKSGALRRASQRAAPG